MELLRELFLPCLWAFLACGAFAVIFNIHGGGILICCAGGSLGWLVYLLGGRWGRSDLVSALLAGVTIAVWSEVMARARKCPATGYLVVALFPLVPGGGIYYAMEYAIQGRTQDFANTLGHTLGLSGALALGVLLVSSGMRMWHRTRKRRESRDPQI